ncbi:MAG: DUF423 domain-containing protein [Bacteroidetes bacterium]|nr:DUF423 domain-containing protein [Bacteroidota bacterium]
MSKSVVILASILLCTAIILGAMAAHGLEELLSAGLIETFEKGVRYQFYAGFALLILGFAKEKLAFSLRWFVRLTVAGVILFSGCIYGYSFHEQIPSLKPLVYLVPIGGSLMIAAWIVFTIQLIRLQK